MAKKRSKKVKIGRAKKKSNELTEGELRESELSRISGGELLGAATTGPIDVAPMPEDGKSTAELPEERPAPEAPLIGARFPEMSETEPYFSDAFTAGPTSKKPALASENIIDLTRKIHKMLATSLDNNGGEPGEFRSDEVLAGGIGALRYVAADRVKMEMDSFSRWLADGIKKADAGKINPIELAAIAGQRLVSIHPFSDGNGRTSRMMMDYILQRYEILPVPLKDIKVSHYAYLDSAARKGSLIRTRQKSTTDAVRSLLSGLRREYGFSRLKKTR